MPLALSSRRIERPEQSSRHSLIPEPVPEPGLSATVFVLNRFSATATVSRPGRNPASNVSFTRWTAGCGTVAAACAEPDCLARSRLAHSQNFIQTRFKVFLALGPQADFFNG